MRGDVLFDDGFIPAEERGNVVAEPFRLLILGGGETNSEPARPTGSLH
jgi:hypothetical protein